LPAPANGYGIANGSEENPQSTLAGVQVSAFDWAGNFRRLKHNAPKISLLLNNADLTRTRQYPPWHHSPESRGVSTGGNTQRQRTQQKTQNTGAFSITEEGDGVSAVFFHK
jgi:transcriptional regulator with PAS, ATPase and Fis domain